MCLTWYIKAVFHFNRIVPKRSVLYCVHIISSARVFMKQWNTLRFATIRLKWKTALRNFTSNELGQILLSTVEFTRHCGRKVAWLKTQAIGIQTTPRYRWQNIFRLSNSRPVLSSVFERSRSLSVGFPVVLTNLRTAAQSSKNSMKICARMAETFRVRKIQLNFKPFVSASFNWFCLILFYNLKK